MSYKKYQRYYNKNKIESSKDITDVDIKEAQKLDKIIFGILIVILALLPLITHLKVEEFISPLITNNANLGSSTVGDVFTYYKYIFLVLSTIVLIILFLYRTFGIGIPLKDSFINIVLAILAIAVAFSALFAPNKTLALIGMYNRHEGAITYLCYFALFFIASNLTYTKKMLYTVVYALYPVTIVNTILGLLGFFGIELINTGFARAILFPSGTSEEAISEGSRFITTINHQNYVSGISVVLIAVFLMRFILDKNKKHQAANGFLAILSFAMMLSSLSRSGFLTFVIILPFLAILLMFSTEKVKNYWKLVVQLVVFAIIFIGMASFNPKVWDESMGMFIAENPFAKEGQALDQKSSNLNAELNNLIFDTADKDYLNEYITFARDHMNVFSFTSLAYAAETTSETIEKFQLPQLPESGIGPGSGRLFIWENTLELVKERPFLGYGLDTFVYHFPQYDPEKIANIETHTVVVDKPHNLYINILYGSGVLALFALLILIATHFFKCAKFILKQKENNKLFSLFMSLFAGWFAYLIQALFNDSVIGTAPIFWIIFGVIVFFVNEPYIKVEDN